MPLYRIHRDEKGDKTETSEVTRAEDIPRISRKRQINEYAPSVLKKYR